MTDPNSGDRLADRRFNPDSEDFRDPYERDLDRILYSSAFRRLHGVTQVVASGETLLFHNRMTHSLKVSQVSRRLAEFLIHSNNAIPDEHQPNPSAVAAAALAHDLGHPPFGHIAEEVLNRECLAAGADGFEGNAQTFRLVTKLMERGWTDLRGVDLTRRSLLGLLKYPWTRKHADPPDQHTRIQKFSVYQSEQRDFAFAVTGDPDAELRGSRQPLSIEAQIMDYADDVSYAVHDLEDFYRARLTPMVHIRHSVPEQERLLRWVDTRLRGKKEYDPSLAEAALERLLQLIPIDKPYDGSDAVRRQLKSMTTALIRNFQNDVEIRTSRNGAPILHIRPQTWHRVNVLKQFTWLYIISSPNLATIQDGQRRLIRTLFDHFAKATQSAFERKSFDVLPVRLRDLALNQDDDDLKGGGRWTRFLSSGPGTKAHIGRAVADYLVSLTETQAIELHRRITGVSSESVLQAWV